MNATAAVHFLRARPRLTKGIQLGLLFLTVGFCTWAVRDQWSKAGPLLENASPPYLALSLAGVRDVNAPLPALIAFALLLTALLHPRVFRPLMNKLLKPFGADSIEPLPFPLTLGLLLFYCGTWLIGGFAVYFMLRSVGAE